jgi:hypothetical protein
VEGQDQSSLGNIRYRQQTRHYKASYIAINIRQEPRFAEKITNGPVNLEDLPQEELRPNWGGSGEQQELEKDFASLREGARNFEPVRETGFPWNTLGISVMPQASHSWYPEQ